MSISRVPQAKRKKTVATFSPQKIEPPTRNFHKLLNSVETLPPIRTIVVHPVDEVSLEGVLVSAFHGLIKPILVGPENKILAAAKRLGADISSCEIVDTPHSHASALKAVALIHEGRAEALMKGAMHSSEFLYPILDHNKGLRTDRRMSHAFLLDSPAFDRMQIITDAALNIAPDLLAKQDIVQNAISLAHAVGIELPKVAVLSAVEDVEPRIPSTVEAAAIAVMARRKQITGAIIDGPLSYDLAVSPASAKIKKIDSDVAGKADVLVVPNLEAGNMLAKQLIYVSDAQAAGIVCGGQIPIILTSRSGSIANRLVSGAVAALIYEHEHKAKPK